MRINNSLLSFLVKYNEDSLQVFLPIFNFTYQRRRDLDKFLSSQRRRRYEVAEDVELEAEVADDSRPSILFR